MYIELEKIKVKNVKMGNTIMTKAKLRSILNGLRDCPDGTVIWLPYWDIREDETSPVCDVPIQKLFYVKRADGFYETNIIVKDKTKNRERMVSYLWKKIKEKWEAIPETERGEL